MLVTLSGKWIYLTYWCNNVAAAGWQFVSSHDAFLRRVRAYGPGIEPTGPIVGAPANFTVETFSAGKGNVDVIVDDPKGNKLPVRIKTLS